MMLNAMESVLGLLTLIGLVSTHAVGEELFRLQTDCSDFLFTDDVVFETDVFSELSCARLCVNYPNCVSFTTTPGPSSTCRGHAGLVTSTSAKLASPGAVTYAAYDDESTTPAVEPGVIPNNASVWLGMMCQKIGDCDIGGITTDCLMEKCHCFRGMYYLVGDDTCEGVCDDSDLGTQFTFYPGGKVNANSFQDTVVSERQDCFSECINVGCHSFNFDPATNTCHFLAAMAWNTQFDMETSFDHYRRTCA